MYGLLKTERSGFFVRSNDGINDFFSITFCYSPTASGFCVARAKAMY